MLTRNPIVTTHRHDTCLFSRDIFNYNNNNRPQKNSSVAVLREESVSTQTVQSLVSSLVRECVFHPTAEFVPPPWCNQLFLFVRSRTCVSSSVSLTITTLGRVPVLCDVFDTCSTRVRLNTTTNEFSDRILLSPSDRSALPVETNLHGFAALFQLHMYAFEGKVRPECLAC